MVNIYYISGVCTYKVYIINSDNLYTKSLSSETILLRPNLFPKISMFK